MGSVSRKWVLPTNTGHAVFGGLRSTGSVQRGVLANDCQPRTLSDGDYQIFRTAKMTLQTGDHTVTLLTTHLRRATNLSTHGCLRLMVPRTDSIDTETPLRKTEPMNADQ